MNNTRILLLLLSLCSAFSLTAQAPAEGSPSATPTASALPTKRTVFAEIGTGPGITFFYGRLEDDRQRRDSAGYANNRLGNNLSTFFFWELPRVPGLGVGAGVKGTFGSSGQSDDSANSYIFNSYHVGVAAKYFLLSRQYNRGLLVRGHFGFGQFTQKYSFPKENIYQHQYGIGTTWLLGVGYALPVGKRRSALSLEAYFEQSTRRGDISGVATNQTFRSGQASLNILYSF